MDNSEKLYLLFELELLTLDQLREIAKSDNSIKLKCEEKCVRVNKIPKNQLPFLIIYFHSDIDKVISQIDKFNETTESFGDKPIKNQKL